MTKREEQAYQLGQREALASIMRECIRGLGYENERVSALIVEREATVAALRRVCAEFGDNDWNANLHLADVVEKHLERHLRERG